MVSQSAGGEKYSACTVKEEWGCYWSDLFDL